MQPHTDDTYTFTAQASTLPFISLVFHLFCTINTHSFKHLHRPQLTHSHAHTDICTHHQLFSLLIILYFDPLSLFCTITRIHRHPRTHTHTRTYLRIHILIYAPTSLPCLPLIHTNSKHTHPQLAAPIYTSTITSSSSLLLHFSQSLASLLGATSTQHTPHTTIPPHFTYPKLHLNLTTSLHINHM